MAEARQRVIDDVANKLANVLEGGAPKADAIINKTAARIRAIAAPMQAGHEVEEALADMYLDIWIMLCARLGEEILSP